MTINKKYKAIIWGHKLHTHTHSYIHNSYYKAFKALGFDTYWFDNNDDISNFNFENCIFFTEDQVHQNIPLNNTSFYILHHCVLDKYIQNNCRYINLCNYVNKCKDGISHNYNDTKTVEKINDYTYVDTKNKALYQPWATDLLPHDVAIKFHKLNKNLDKIYYIGSIWQENIKEINDFNRACIENKKQIINIKNVDDETNRRFISESYISPDLRGEFHRNIGYIPCRIFKNLSYGYVPATNSLDVRDFFGDNTLPYSDNGYDLFKINEEFINNESNLKNIEWILKEIKEKHTYLNRISSILQFI